MKKSNIKSKIFTYFIAFVAFLIALLWLLQIVFLEDFYKYVKTNSIKNIITTIQNDYQQNEELNLDTYSRNNEIQIRLINEKGSIIAQSQSIDSPNIFKIPLHEMDRIFNAATQEGVQITFNGMGKNPSEINYALKLDDNLVLFVQANLMPVNATVNTLKVQLIIVSLLLIIIALIISSLISRKLSRPIISLNENVKKLGTGDFSVEFDGVGYKEIVELSSALNQMKSDLSQIQALKDDLLANVGHDLQTPLTMIIGYSELMLDIPNEQTPENIELIKNEAQYLSNLVSDILDLSKLQSGNPVTIDVYAELTNLINRFKALSNHLISLNCPKDCFVLMDKTQFIQVFYNLLNNAINHSKENQPIEINISVKEKSVYFEVVDYGLGISQEDLPYVWDRYYRSNKQHQRSKLGSGLGLSIIKRIFDYQNIKYGVSSDENIKTVFWFEIQT